MCAPSHFDAARDRATKRSAFADTLAVVETLAASGGDEAEDGRDDDVLEQQDREHQVRLVVGEPAEVRQRLDGDRARGDVDARGDDERREADAERRDADEQPEPGIDDEVARRRRDRRADRSARGGRR